MDNYKLLYLSKKQIINLLIVAVWFIFFLLNWITYSRVMLFLVILEIIVIYRIIINKWKYLINLEIQNATLLKYLKLLNKYRNPFLLCLIKMDVLMYDIIISYNNYILNSIIYIIYILIINPLKIFFFKFYKILWIWKTNNIWDILLNRMFGLILSLLIFTNIITYMTDTLNINILMILYLYLLITSILCELIKTRENKILKIFLVNNIHTRSVVCNRLEVSILSAILKKNNINELTLYFNEEIDNKIQKFQVGYMWYIINSLNFLTNKPTYNLYYDLRIKLYKYLALRIDKYIYFKYYNWEIPNIHLIEITDVKNLPMFEKIYEYDYMVFKTLLFLYWDLEYYLEGKDYVKNSLIVDADNIDFFNIMLKDAGKSDILFFEKIKYKPCNPFWTNQTLIDLILNYDIYSKMFDLDNRYKADINFHIYKLYEKYNKTINDDELDTLMEVQSNPLGISNYHKYIDMWYNEWLSEINMELLDKYSQKVELLEIEYYNIFK